MTKTAAKRFFGFVAGGLTAILLATGANAAVVVGNLGALNAGDSEGFAKFTSTANSAQLSGGQIFEFMINSGTFFDAASASVKLGTLIGISGLTMDLVESTSAGFASFSTLAVGTPSGSEIELSYSGLSSGISYGLLFTGVITGTRGGTYAGTYTVSAVPLPPAVWLSLSALIGLAGVVRHKRKGSPAIQPKKAEREKVGLAA